MNTYRALGIAGVVLVLVVLAYLACWFEPAATGTS